MPYVSNTHFLRRCCRTVLGLALASRRACLGSMLAAGLALPGVSVHGAGPGPIPSTPSTAINVSAPSASSPAVGSILVTVDGLSPEQTRNARLLSAVGEVATANAVATVTFGPPVALAPGTGQRSWMLPFQVDGLPAGTTQTRYVAFKVGATDWALPYQIVSPPAPTTSWNLKPPPAVNRRLHPREAIPISIAVDGRTPISGVQLKPLDLVEQSTMESLTRVEWRLCPTQSLCDEPIVKPLGGGPHHLWIVPVSDIPHGKYTGAVTIASLDKPSGESVGLTLNVSSWRAKLLGFVVILVGVATGLYAATFLRRRAERDQLLLGPSVLRMQAIRMSEVLHADPLAVTPAIDKKLTDLLAALNESALENAGLPPKIPLPWPASIDGFRKHVEVQSSMFNSLRALAEDGVLPLLTARHEEELRDGPLDTTEVTAFDAAMKAIDAIAATATLPEPAKVPGLTQPLIDKFKDAVQDSRVKGLRSAALAPPVPQWKRPVQLRTPEQLRFRIMQASVVAWAILGAVTAATGTYILVLTNPGFGTVLDYFVCFLWGAGLPAGTALATANTSTVSTALSIAR